MTPLRLPTPYMQQIHVFFCSGKFTLNSLFLIRIQTNFICKLAELFTGFSLVGIEIKHTVICDSFYRGFEEIDAQLHAIKLQKIISTLIIIKL